MCLAIGSSNIRLGGTVVGEDAEENSIPFSVHKWDHISITVIIAEEGVVVIFSKNLIGIY